MNKINLEEKSLEIQSLISRYTKESFVCFFADFIRHHPERVNIGFSEKLKSKYKDSLYLIMLRLSSDEVGVESLTYSFENDKILQEVAGILLEIVTLYLSENYVDDYFSVKDERQKLLIHEMVFKDYFQNGVLNYKEQEINNIVRLFKPYQDKIRERLGVSLKALINLCDYSEVHYRKKSEKIKSFILDQRFHQLASDSSKGLIQGEEFSNRMLELPERLQENILDFFEKPYNCLLFNKDDYYTLFNKEEVDIFCELFSIGINEKFNNLFYSQLNPLEAKPIIKINDTEFINICQKQLPTALYNLLYQTLSTNNIEKEKLNLRRGKVVLENQTLDVFRNLFKKSRFIKIFRNYYINEFVEEKDILIIINKRAFVIECKASRNREPRRNTKQAYQRIKSDFNDCIQKGYAQCYQVEQEILCKDKIIISTKKVREEMNTADIEEVYSIVVTSKRFGSIQSDLELLLKRKNDQDLFPWSISVDDLEIFVKTLCLEFNNPIKKFFDFLDFRELLNGRLITTDELDVCAMFIKNQKSFKELCYSEHVIFTDPLFQNYFDKLYFKKKLNFKILNL